jgi:hypothetical protein
MRVHVEAFEDRMATLATMTVGKLWDRLLGEFLAEWERLDRMGLAADVMERELLAFMEALSVKPLEDLARTSSTVAYNQGRGAEMLTAAMDGRSEFVVRSEVLDTRTCRTCATLDGTVVPINSPEFNQFMPPAMCEGGDRCRGFYIAVPQGMAA